MTKASRRHRDDERLYVLEFADFTTSARTMVDTIELVQARGGPCLVSSWPGVYCSDGFHPDMFEQLGYRYPPPPVPVTPERFTL